MSDSLKIQGVVEVSTEGAESSLGRVGNAADKMAVNMSAAGAKAGKAVDQIGEIAKATGEKFTRAESVITGSLKKLAVEAAKAKSVTEGLGNIEFNIAAKGLDPAKFQPMINVVRQLAAEYSHLETAQARTSGSSGQFGRGLQNSSYQLQDFIVQVNGGVDATKALGQQLPQLLVGFGAAGAAIGVVAALLPNIIAAFSNSAEGAKKFSDALSDFDKAVGDVGSTVKSFDMEKLYEEFNNSSSAVRAATIEQIKFQQEYIKTTQLVAGKKFGESLGGMGEYSTLDKLAGSYGSSGAEKLAKQLGVTVEVAKDLLPVLGGLKSGSEDVGLAFSKFGTTLLGGNAKAVELAQTMATLSKSERDGAAASSALSEAQAKMAKGHIVTKKEAEAAAKATKASSKATEEFSNLLDKINGKESGLNAEYWNELERLNAAYKSGAIPLDAYSELVDKLTKQQPFYVKGLKEEAEALKDITDLERERAKYAADISKETKDLIEKADAAEYENSKIGATEQQLIALTAARYDEQIALKQEKIAAIEMMEGRNAEVEAIEQQISALRRLQSAEIAKPKLREQAREWEKFSDDINRALTDALMRGFESGKSFGENFVDSLKNSLKTAALKLVVNVVTSTGGSVVNAAINAVAGTGGANGGAGTNYMGLANNASSMYNMYGAASQLFTGASVGASTASLAYANGVGMIGGDSLGALYAANGGWAGVEAGGAAASAVGAEAGWSSMLGEAAAGAWVLAIPAIAGAISAAGSRKAYEFDGVAIKGDYAGSNFTGSAATKWQADSGWWESGDEMKKWMPLTGDKDAIISAFFGGGMGAAGRTGYVNPVSGEYSKASDLANLGDLRDTPSFTGVDNSKAAAEWDAQYAAWQKANPISFMGGSEGREWAGGERPDGVTSTGFSGVGGMLGTVSRTPVLSTDPVMLAALDNAIDAIFKATQTSFKALADQFDDADLAGKINDFSTSINLDTKSGDIDKVLAGLASDVNAKMAQAFLPSIETLRLPEEAWQAAFNRVMVEVAGTSRILDLMGMSIKETFGSDTNKAITAIDGLSKAFGGIDALSTSFGAYYANFYSAEEQRARSMEDMGKAFTSLNLAMPTTREGFKAIVDGLDLATTGGQATFKAMMDLQGGFANLVPAIAETALATEDAAAAARALADAAALLSDRMLSAIDAAQAGITNSASAGMNQLVKAIDLEKQRVNIAREAAAESVASIKGVFDLLTSQVSELYGSVSSTKTSSAAQGADFISQALATAKASGYLPDQAALSDAINSAKGGLGADQYASQFEADRATLVMAGQLSQLKTISGNQLPVAERALKAAEDQLTALDASLDYYQQQVDALLSIDENTLTLSGSIEEMGKAIIEALKLQSGNLSAAILQSLATGQIGSKDASEKLAAAGVKTDELTKIGGYDAFVSSGGAVAAGGKLASNSGWTGSIPEAKAGITAAYNSMSASSFYAAALGEGLSAAMVDALYGFVPGTANKWAAENKLPKFAVGTNYVPKDMVAQIHEGEAIVPKAYNPAAGGGANARLEGLVEALTAEVQRLQAIVNTGNQHASRTANAVNGNPEQPMLVENV